MHCLDVIPGPEGGDGVAVAEIVQAGVWQADGGYKTLEAVIDRVGGQVLPGLIAENKAIVLPNRARPEAVTELPGAVLLQELDHGGGGGDRAALVVLGGDKAKLSRLAGDVLELLV